MTILMQLKCRFVQLLAWYITRTLYHVNADDVLKELNKVRRYIFYMESGCASSSDFIQEIFQYLKMLTPIPSNCLNCP
jgi:hypothetical protein